MGYASCSEANSERYYDNMHMQDRLPMSAPERPLAPEPLYVVSPSVQPALVRVPLTANEAEAYEKRRREARLKHMLALAELLPGKNWRH